jgi:Fe-S oxidoreductase
VSDIKPTVAENPNPVSPEPAPSGATIDSYFKNLMLLNQAFADEPFRNSRAQPDAAAVPSSGRSILWLGCNVLRTPHLAQLATTIMGMLNPELSVLGGPSHCCGSPMTEQSEREYALKRTIHHFKREQSPTLVSWCPSCHTNLRKGSDPASWGFDELHVTEFLACHLKRLTLKLRISARVMLHGHTGTPDRDKDMSNCRTLLNAIPGITIAAEHSDEELDLHCVPSRIAARIGMEAYERKVQEMIAHTRDVGAQMMVTIYHSCYREIEKRLTSGGIEIENYITLLARALDIPVPRNVYREIAHGGEARIADLKCEAQTRGIATNDLDTAIKAEF